MLGCWIIHAGSIVINYAGTTYFVIKDDVSDYNIIEHKTARMKDLSPKPSVLCHLIG